MKSLIEIIAKYGILINELGVLYSALLEMFIRKIAMWKTSM